MLEQNAKLKGQIEVEKKKTMFAEKERDYYFGKLRDIELLMHASSNKAEQTPSDVLKAIQTILYAREDENIEVDEEGNILI